MPVYEFAGFRLDVEKRLLLQRDGTSVGLTPKGYETLAYLVEHPGAVLEKEQIIRVIWPDTAVEENNLTQNISLLRRVLGEERGEHRFIATVPGRGYQFVAPVSIASREEAQGSVESFSIAVLPFTNNSTDPEYDYFADGLADELIHALSMVGGVRVAARTSAFSFRGKQVHVREIAAALGVAFVLEGAVRKSDHRLRITAQLVNAATGYQLWSERYEREIGSRDLFDVQDEITVAVMNALRSSLPGSHTDTQISGHRRRAAESPKAHELYLKGRFHLFQMTARGIQTGIRHFEQAIAENPGYAPAHVGLAHAHRMFGLSLDMPNCAVGPKAKEAAMKAMEIDNNLAEAHAVLAFTLYWYEWDMSAAARHFQRALQLDPNSADTLWMYAHLPSNFGHHDEALNLISRARQLDPLSGLINAMEGQFLLHAGRVSEALDRLKEALELNPKSRVAHVFASSALLEGGRYEEAIFEARAAYELAPVNTQSLAFEGYAHAKAGRQSQACAILDRLLEMKRSRYIPPQNIALVYNALDQPADALEWLERAVEQRDPKLVFIKVEPKWKNLREEPRFISILRRVNLLPA